MKVTVKLLLQFVFWNHAMTTSAPATELAKGSHERQQDTTVLEMRGATFLNLSLVEYAEALASSKNAVAYGASADVAQKLMEKAAREMSSLSFGPVKERRRLTKILSSLKTVMTVHHGSLTSSTSAPKDSARHIQTQFAECAKLLSSNGLWKGTCMSGLLQKSQLKTLFPHFSPQFVQENLGPLLFAAVTTGNSDLLRRLASPPSGSVRQDLVKGIALSGSIEILDEVQRYVPTIAEAFLDMLIWALHFGQERFVHKVLPRALAKANGKHWDAFLRATFSRACFSGALGTVIDLIHDHSEELERADLLEGLNEAAAAGHLSVVLFLVLETTSPIKDPIFSLPAVLITAAKHNRVNILKFFLVEWEDPRRRVFENDIAEMFAAAAEGGALKAMRLLLAKDRWGQNLASRFEISSTLGKIVGLGHLEVLQYLWMLEKSSSRLQRINWKSGWHSALAQAGRNNALGMLEFFLQVDDRGEFVIPGIDSTPVTSRALCQVCRAGHLGIVRELLRTDAEGHLVHKSVKLDDQSNEALVAAAAEGHLEIVRLLLQRSPQGEGYLFKDIDPAFGDQILLRVAAMSRRHEIVELLLKRDDHGAPIHPGVTVPSGLLQELAFRQDHVDIVALLLEHDIVDREAEIRAALEVATELGSPLMCDFLQKGLKAH